jgi:hypothetical protein
MQPVLRALSREMAVGAQVCALAAFSCYSFPKVTKARLRVLSKEMAVGAQVRAWPSLAFLFLKVTKSSLIFFEGKWL